MNRTAMTLVALALPLLLPPVATNAADPPVAATAAPVPGVTTLDAAFRRALSANPRISRAREEVTAAEADRKMRFSWVLPRLTLSGSVAANSEEVTFGSDGDSRTILPSSDWSTRLTLTQPIFAGLREKRAYDQAKMGIVGAEAALDGSEETLLVEVAADWFSVLYNEALVEVEAGGVELARRRKALATDLFEAGETTRVEVLRAEVAEKAALRRLAAARQERETSAGRLRIDLALDPRTEVVVPSEVPDIPLPPLPGEDELVTLAGDARAEVRQARAALEIARLEVAKQKGAYWPVLSLEAFWAKQKTTFPVDEYQQAAIRLSWPVFQSGEVEAKVAMASARLRQAQASLDELERELREQVRQALLQLETARTDADLALEQQAAAEAEQANVAELYRVQETTAVDAEAAENAVLDARRAAVTGRLQRQLYELRVWAVAGSLRQAVLQETAR